MTETSAKFCAAVAAATGLDRDTSGDFELLSVDKNDQCIVLIIPSNPDVGCWVSVSASAECLRRKAELDSTDVTFVFCRMVSVQDYTIAAFLRVLLEKLSGAPQPHHALQKAFVEWISSYAGPD